MSEETDVGTQTLDSSSETIELRLRQEMEMEPTLDETHTDVLTMMSVYEKTKQATEPTLTIAEKMCAILLSWPEVESASTGEASGSRRNRESSSPWAAGTTPPLFSNKKPLFPPIIYKEAAIFFDTVAEKKRNRTEIPVQLTNGHDNPRGTVNGQGDPMALTLASKCSSVVHRSDWNISEKKSFSLRIDMFMCWMYEINQPFSIKFMLFW